MRGWPLPLLQGEAMKEKHDARESHVYRERIRWAERVKELREKEKECEAGEGHARVSLRDQPSRR